MNNETYKKIGVLAMKKYYFDDFVRLMEREEDRRKFVYLRDMDSMGGLEFTHIIQVGPLGNHSEIFLEKLQTRVRP